MDKWLLLLLSGAAIWFIIDMARWLGLLRKSPQEDLENLTGVSRDNRNPPEIRNAMTRLTLFVGFSFLNFLFVFAVLVSVALIIATVRAFLA